MTKSRYVAASIAQYLHELSGRHADERENAREKQIERVIDARRVEAVPALAGR